MKKQILEKITEIFYQLSDAERRVASCVMSDPVRVQYMSITELSEQSGVGDATVTRFCRHLGLSGFYALKLELAKAQGGEEKAREYDTVIDASLRDAVAALNATAKTLEKTVLYDAVSRIGRAERVLCAGAGGSMLIAAECAHLFATVTPKMLAVPDTHLQLMSLASMKEGDVLLLFSYSGATKSGAELLRYAKERGVYTVLLTGFARSPLGKLADTVLTCAAHEGPDRIGSIPARMAQLLVVDALFCAYCEEKEETTEYVTRIAEALSDQHL